MSPMVLVGYFIIKVLSHKPRLFSQHVFIHVYLLTVCLLTDSRFQRPSPRSQKQPIRVLEETLTGKTEN